MEGLTDRLAVLRLRNFRNLFIGQTVSLFGNGLVPVALTFAVLDLTGSGTDVGLVLAAFAAPEVLFTLVGGVWADRLRRERVMIASDLFRCVVMAVIAALLLTDRAQIWSLALSGFVFGCGEAFFFPAATALIPQIVPTDRLQEANALRGVADGLGWFVGPSVSGVLVALIGSGGALAVDAATFLVSAGFLLTLRVPAPARDEARGTFLAELRGGWHEVRSRTWLWAMMLSTMLVLFVTISPLQVLGPLAITEHRESPALWGFLVGLFSLGMLVGGLVALYYKPARPLVAVTLLGLSVSAPMAALALQLPATALCTVWFLRGITIGVLIAIWQATLQREIPGESLGRVSSWDWMVSGGLWPVGLVLAGPLAEVMGLSTALWLSAILGIVFGIWVLLLPDVWRVRSTTTPPSRPPVSTSTPSVAE
jgi:MFS family permease